MPNPPPPNTPQGVLPCLIVTLVSHHWQVKALMKDWDITPAKLLQVCAFLLDIWVYHILNITQYDIKQTALKLMANSMYGCLGFKYSCFYAWPLATLTTYKGREILTNMRETTESLNLNVRPWHESFTFSLTTLQGCVWRHGFRLCQLQHHQVFWSTQDIHPVQENYQRLI